MDTMLINVSGTDAYLDDVLFFGRTDEELLERLDKVIENLIDYGLEISIEKGEFLRKEVHYLSLVLSEAGRSPDLERVAAFKNVKLSRNVQELRAFMGLPRFSPSMTDSSVVTTMLHPAVEPELRFWRRTGRSKGNHYVNQSLRSELSV
ncbi:unnamed protein product [Dibothriocephalus latus]|uniref:Reverse transcriptase domain-containing protein n=1 Tax=Dibothriocephalus latus TaxID=60516 RepID=A0A3P7LVQ2_DIBLA|nr:unnamed protein product [Dibothriocephalus latus]